MELNIYHGEHFERSKTRYIIFFLIISLIIVGSILSGNYIGAVIVLFFVGGYFFFLIKTNTPCTMKIEENWLQIKEKIYLRREIKGFVLEYNTKQQQIKNIVIVKQTSYDIFTIQDTDDILKDFLTELNNYIPLLESFEQSFFEKFIRKIQL